MELTLIQRADEAERANTPDEFRIISEAALAVFGWQDERYKRVLKLLEAGASIDAAMSLVPEQYWDHMEVYRPNHQDLGWTVYLLGDSNAVESSHGAKGFARSHRLALCAAALRARSEAAAVGGR